MKQVYILEMDDKDKLVKIGVSKNIKNRMSGIRCAGGRDIIRHYETEFMPTNKAVGLECDLHTHFANYRTFGEFFKITFEEACAELDRRNPHSIAVHIFTPLQKDVDTVRQFVETFCTTDKSEGGVCGGGIAKESFYKEIYQWICGKFGFFEYKNIREIDLLSYLNEIFEGNRIHEDSFKPANYIGGELKRFYAGIYWKKGTPQELALQQRVQRVRNAFMGLDQREQDAIIGGFVTDIMATLSQEPSVQEILKEDELIFDHNIYQGIDCCISERLSELCGETVRVDTDFRPRPYFYYREIIVEVIPQELDDAAVGFYHSNFLQLVQRYCPAVEVFFDNPYWCVRYVGKEKEERRGEES